VHPVQGTAGWAAAPLVLTLLLCGGGSWAQEQSQLIRLQCDVVTADSREATRQLWEITDSTASLDGTQFPATVTVSDSEIAIAAEYIYRDSMVSATVRIDRPSGKITLAVSKRSPEQASTSQTVPWTGTCTDAPARP
jgi:hypothetical protein